MRGPLPSSLSLGLQDLSSAQVPLVVDLETLLLGARPQGGPLQLTLMAGSDQPS